MCKVTFMGAGSTVFARNILGDIMMTDSLRESHIALYDIDPDRLEQSRVILEMLNASINQGRAQITSYLGVENRKDALKNATFVVNAVQVGGYRPSTVIDFEIPKKYGLRQTIGDTLGIGGIFRALRTIPVVLDFARDMEEVCPNAWFLNYVNPMAIITGALLHGSSIKTVGLCHSVQACVKELLKELEIDIPAEETNSRIAGINHMAWLLEISHNGRDLYPRIKKQARERVAILEQMGTEKILKAAEESGDPKWRQQPDPKILLDKVRLEIMHQFGYYVTESSEHNAEYMPYWIKSGYPELIDQFSIPLDEYPRRCEYQIDWWKRQYEEMKSESSLTHSKSVEYGCSIMESIQTDKPARIAGNILNNGLISNLPDDAIVEVPCLVDRNGVQGCFAGELPAQCAALNQTVINVQKLTLEAALENKKEAIYHAAFLDPHTSSELPLDAIRSMCDELIEAHGDMLPSYS